MLKHTTISLKINIIEAIHLNKEIKRKKDAEPLSSLHLFHKTQYN